MKKALVLLLVMLICALSFVNTNAYALTVDSITATPDTPGAIAAYTAQITTTQPLTATSDYVRIVFPSAFTVPTSINASSITINGSESSSVAVSSTTVDIHPSVNVDVYSVTICIYTSANIRNPSTGGQYYSISISTSKETTGINHSLYIQSAIRNLTVAPNPLYAGSYAAYTISFVPNTTLVTNDHIYIEFPSGTTLPSTVQPSYININGHSCVYVSKISNTRLDVRTPITLNANYMHTITISSNFCIKNPVTPGEDYTVQLSTSKEPYYATSNVYTIIGSNITNLTISASPNSAYTTATYSIWFVTGSSGALSTNDYIKIEFPQGTTVASGSTSRITINGYPCAYRTVSGTTLTVYIPSGLSIGNSSSCNILIPESYGIKNPTIGTYTLLLSTNKDTTPAASNSYAIVGTSVSNFTVSADPTTQNSTAAYTFNFRTSSTGALSKSASDKIYIQFPTEFTVPSSISKSYVTVNGTPCTTNISVSSNKLTITTPVNIENSSSNIPIVISQNANIKNSSSSDTYTFSILTTKDIVPASANLQIVESTITKPIVQLTGYSVNEIIGVTVTFQTGSGGALTKNSDKISIVFPAGFVLPYSISKQYVKVNNYNTISVTKSGQRIDITPSIDISPNANVVVVIDKAANIKNPGSQSDYKLSVYTSKETTQIYSDIFNIVILPTTTFSVTPQNPDGQNGYYITTPKVTLAATSPVDTNPTIYYYFDSGNPIVYSGVPVLVIEGSHTLYFYAVDHQGNAEQTQSKQFKVDITPPEITSLSPQDGSILNTKECTITGKTESSATVTINNKAVSVDANGNFSYSDKISGETTFTIIAEDIAGNKTTVKLRLSLDTTSPKLQVTEPYAFQEIHTQTVIVKGTTEQDATVKINDQPVQLTAEYTFSYALMLTNEGLTSINITATDLAGNVTKVSIPVNFIPKTNIMLQIGNSVAVINGKTIKLDSPPIIIKDRTLVPLRFISEAFGAKVEWNSVFRLVFINMGEKKIIVQIGIPYASINGIKVLLDSPPLIVKDRTMVPLRFIAEALGAEVTWDKTTKSITIIYPGG
ncbi:MAG: stalk domain-containing protein [Caldisericota bacterium]|nr:stalk domain-containing protein [Caldisericota bacterium]